MISMLLFLSEIQFDWVITPATIISGIGIPSIIGMYIQNEKKKDREKTLERIEQKAMFNTFLYSANGKREEFITYFNAEKKRMMGETKFVDGD